MTSLPKCIPAWAPRRLATLVLVLGLTACSSQTAAPSEQPTPTNAPVATATQGATPAPTPSPRTPAPAELLGRWETSMSDTDHVVLTFTAYGYSILRLGMGTGGIEVTGDQIRFYGSNLCTGDGIYRWSIENGNLTLAAVGDDPCANRADAIRNRPFTRIQ